MSMQLTPQTYRIAAESPADIIAFEECLISSWRGGTALLLFYVNSPSVIIGRNQNYWREIAPSCAVPVYRRSSGGGAVYHDTGNLNWALIVPRAAHDQGAELALMARAVSQLGIAVHPGERGGLFVVREDDGSEGKVSGTARRFGTHNVLHHGTLLVLTDMRALKSSLGGLRLFEDASIASVPATPVNLNQFIPSMSVDEAEARISSYLVGRAPEIVKLSQIYEDAKACHKAQLERSEDEIATRDSCPDLALNCEDFDAFRRQFCSREWIVGRSPPFSITVSDNGADAVVRVERGRIADIRPLDQSDMHSVRYADLLQDRYMGLAFDFNVEKVLESVFFSKNTLFS